MISDYDLALACQATYSGIPQTWGTDVTHAYQSNVNGTCVIAFEGTVSLDEWMIDFEAVPVDERGFNHADLGCVHLGWWRDVASVANPIITYVLDQQAKGVPVACGGHSKGAGEALIFAALAKTQGVRWSRVSTFGTPHPGHLNGLITAELGCDYRDMTDIPDPVPKEPFYLPRPRPITEVKAPLPLFNVPDYELMIAHHIQNYVAALKGLS